jgi:hypothetical protein
MPRPDASRFAQGIGEQQAGPYFRLIGPPRVDLFIHFRLWPRTVDREAKRPLITGHYSEEFAAALTEAPLKHWTKSGLG